LNWYKKSLHGCALKVFQALQALPEIEKKEMTGKVKFHFLLHLCDCVSRFGPPCLTHTEKEESYNGKVRTVIKNSNRRTYSFHTAKRFSEFQSLTAILHGAFFPFRNGAWRCASAKVIRVGKYITKDSYKKGFIDPNIHSRIYGSRVIVNGYSTGIGGFLKFNSSDGTQEIMKLTNIRNPTNALLRNVLIGLKCKIVSSDRFGNCVYEVSEESISIDVSNACAILNMQHICDAQCKLSDARKTVEKTQIPTRVFTHSNSSYFVMNSFCFSF
jgi:hypothetical protein